MLALQLCGVTRGDRVLVPTYHCPTMIAPLEYLGATPAFYPLKDTGRPDLEFLSQMDCSGVRAMLAAHLFGIPQPLSSVAEFCHSRDILLIEDCAHCFYGSAGEESVGSTGDFAIGSLPKFFPVLEGGLLAWHDATTTVRVPTGLSFISELRAIWDILDRESSFGRFRALALPINLLKSVRYRVGRGALHVSIADSGDCSPELVRSTSLRDPLLIPRQMRRVERALVAYTNSGEFCFRRQSNFNRLVQLLSDLPNATPINRHCGDTSAPYVMPLYIHNGADRHYATMRRLRLPVFRWDRVWPGTPSLPGDVAAGWTHNLVQIACHQSLTPEDLGLVAKAIRLCISESATER